jgi:hypothetical protein
LGGAGSGGEPPAAQAAGGRGGQALGPIVAPGRYRATLGSLSGGTVTPLGEPQAFQVVPLPR